MLRRALHKSSLQDSVPGLPMLHGDHRDDCFPDLCITCHAPSGVPF